MLGSAFFVGVFTVEGWLRPGYDPLRTYVSDLAIGPRGWIQVVSFFVLGALILLFARGVAAEFPEGKASRAGPVLLGIIGVGLFVSGLFVTDPTGTPRDQVSLVGRLHNLFGAVVFSLSPVSCCVFFRRFHADHSWRALAWWTLAAGAITTSSVILMAVGPAQPPAAPNAFNNWVGAIQRTVLVTYLAWLFTFALRLHWRRVPAR